MKITRKTLEWYFDHGYQPIPLTRPDDMSLPIAARGKKPLHRHWPSKTYTIEEIIKYSQTHNIGCALRPYDLVIDVDPRSHGDVGLENLLSFLSFPGFCTHFPAVRTGSGGLHLYTKIPFDTYLEFEGKFRTHHDKFQGIDFKSGLGHQVVIPGSVHAQSNELYKWDNNPHDFEAVPEAPEALLLELGMEAAPIATPLIDAPYTPTQLADTLSNLDATDYSTHDTWFDMMVASYHATGGEGLDEFLEWSTSDPQYAGHGINIMSRWKSLGVPCPTEKTLTYFLKQYRARRLSPLPHMRIVNTEILSSEDLPSARELDELSPAPAKSLHELRGLIELVTPDDALNDLLYEIAKTSPLERKDLAKDLARQSGRPEQVVNTALRGIIRDLDEEWAGPDKGEKIDVVAEVVDLMLRRLYDDGRTIVNARDQQAWLYDGIVWRPALRNQLNATILEAIKEFREISGLRGIKPHTLISSVRALLEAETTHDIDLLRASGELDPVVNTRNCEVWTRDDGAVDICQHTAEHYLTSAVPFPYDPKAECPTFDHMLKGMFAPCFDAEEVIEHLWEMIGYVIQPLKNLSHWWLFYGKGHDGKSKFLSIIDALLGESALSKELGSFNISKNKHAYCDLVGKLAVIDDDLKLGTALPDEFLKKATENKKLTADPKGRDPFQFSVSTSILVSSNHLPHSGDVSWAMRRRAVVIPCRRSFTLDEADPTIAPRVIAEELPGVLAKALRALRRLRRRGQFKIPDSCKRAAATWVEEANQVANFVADCCTPRDDLRNDFGPLWESFKLWAYEEGLRKHYTRRQFRKTLDDMGFTVARGTGGRYQVRGLKIQGGE
jgi:P4 family phage/plasmid primase-like protien